MGRGVVHPKGICQAVLPLDAPALGIALGGPDLLPRPASHAQHLRIRQYLGSGGWDQGSVVWGSEHGFDPCAKLDLSLRESHTALSSAAKQLKDPTLMPEPGEGMWAGRLLETILKLGGNAVGVQNHQEDDRWQADTMH